LKEQLQTILELKKQLHHLGYQPWQIDMIIQDAIGSNLLHESSQEQIEQVAEILKGYVSFAANRAMSR